MIEFAQIIETFIQHWEIVFLFFFIAVLYSTVGFGGGSSYLALLTLTSFVFVEIRAIALLCNIVVVSSGTYIYAKNGLYSWKKIIPLISISIPLAFLGGSLRISQTLFFVLLGITLVIAAIFMWLSNYLLEKSKIDTSKEAVLKDISIGGFIGFVSGMVGIGGGIFLAPLLHLTHWDTPKKIAATASFFILVNSIAGLIGQFQNPEFSIDIHFAIILMVTVFLGGQIGSRLSIKKAAPFVLKRATAVLIAFVGVRILWKYLILL